MDDVLRAIEIAYQLHAGQVGKDGLAYIHHPLAVMSRLDTNAEMIVGVLHDGLEDAADRDAALHMIQSAFDATVVDAIQCMTHQDGEDYRAYIRRVSENAIAIRVKLADLMENMRTDRLPDHYRDWHARRLDQYQWAFAYLTREIVTYGLAVPGEPNSETVQFAADALRRLEAQQL